MSYPILFFHGTPGDDSQAYVFRSFTNNTIITWDRSTQRTPPSIGKAHLLALSGGGPYALEYAHRYADLTASLTLCSAVTQPPSGRFPPRFFGRWLINVLGTSLLRRKPFWAWKGWLKKNAASRLVYDQCINNKQCQKWFWQLVDSQIPFKLDKQLKAEVKFIKDYEYKWAPLQCPAYIIHDRNDKNVPISHAHNALKHMNEVHYFDELEATGHLCFFGTDAQFAWQNWSQWIDRIR